MSRSLAGPGRSRRRRFFLDNLKRVLKIVPNEKIVPCRSETMATTRTNVHPRSKRTRRSEAKVRDAEDIKYKMPGSVSLSYADADLDLDYNSLNPHYSYKSMKMIRCQHCVWFLDSVTLLDEMRWRERAGNADLLRSGRSQRRPFPVVVFDSRAIRIPLKTRWGTVPTGHDLDEEGRATILRVPGTPKPGRRTVQIDNRRTDPPVGSSIDELWMRILLGTAEILWATTQPAPLALSFVRWAGPGMDAEVLDILKRRNVKGSSW